MFYDLEKLSVVKIKIEIKTFYSKWVHLVVVKYEAWSGNCLQN